MNSSTADLVGYPGLATPKTKQSKAKAPSYQEPSFADMMGYAAPTCASGFLITPIWAILPGIYAKYFGLELTTIAAVILFARLFDGITDPIVGYVADRHRMANGSRKTWAIAGGILTLIACYFLFAPPIQVTTSYYLLWTFAYFLAFTIMDIPHMTWGSELTLDYNGRAKVFSVRNIFLILGALSFNALPFLPVYATNDYTPEVLKDAVYIGAALMLCSLAWMLFLAPAGYVIKSNKADNFKLFIRSFIHNKPLLIYFSAYFCVGLGYGMWFGLLFIYLDSYLAMGEKLAIMLTVGTVIALFATPLWFKVIQLTNKPIAWIAGVLLFCMQLAIMPLVSPNTAWWLPLLLICVANFSLTSHNIAAVSTLGDIVDYGKFKFHKDRGATYFAFNTLLFKVALGVGGGLSLGIAGLFGFDPASHSHSGMAIFGLQLGFIILPIVFGLTGIVFILRTPINRRRHGVIQRRLASRLST